MISRVVNRRLCRMRPSIDEILSLLIPTCAYQDVASSCCLHIRPHNPGTTGIWYIVRNTALFTPLTLNSVSILPFWAKKINNCFLCWFGGIHRATNLGYSSEMRICVAKNKATPPIRKQNNALRFDTYATNYFLIVNRFYLKIINLCKKNRLKVVLQWKSRIMLSTYIYIQIIFS